MYSKYIGFCLYLKRRCLKKQRSSNREKSQRSTALSHRTKNRFIPWLNILNTFSKRRMVMQWNNTKIKQKGEDLKNKVLKKSLTKQRGRQLRSTKRRAINGWGRNDRYPLWTSQNLIMLLQSPLCFCFWKRFFKVYLLELFTTFNLLKCAECGCTHNYCKESISQVECARYSFEECCCWLTVRYDNWGFLIIWPKTPIAKSCFGNINNFHGKGNKVFWEFYRLAWNCSKLCE